MSDLEVCFYLKTTESQLLEGSEPEKLYDIGISEISHWQECKDELERGETNRSTTVKREWRKSQE